MAKARALMDTNGAQVIGVTNHGVVLRGREMNPNTTQFLTTEQAAKYLNVAPVTLGAWRTQGQGPAYLKLGRCVRYSLAAIDAWVAGRSVGGTVAA